MEDEIKQYKELVKNHGIEISLTKKEGLEIVKKNILWRNDQISINPHGLFRQYIHEIKEFPAIIFLYTGGATLTIFKKESAKREALFILRRASNLK